VSAITIRRELLRRRRHLAVMAAVLVLGAAVVLHHDGMAMGGMHDPHGMSAGIELCLGLITAVATAVAAIAVGLLALPSWPQARPPVPRARAGPPLLCLLCVSQR